MWQHQILWNISSWELHVIIRPSRDNGILLTGSGIYPQIMKEVHALQYLFVKSLVNNRGGVNYFEFDQRRHVSSRDVALFFYTLPKKVISKISSFAKKRRYLGTDLKEEVIDFFWKLLEFSLFLQAE